MTGSTRQPSLVDGAVTEEARGLGYRHAYFGDGKGKTTAGLGLAVRAAGAGYKVRLVQFDKGYDDDRGEHYAERRILRQIEEIDLQPTGCERIRADGTFRFGVEPGDRAEAQRGLDLARDAIAAGDVDVLILDEALAALAYKLIREPELVEILDAHEAAGRPCELVLTGHKLPDAIKERVDLVTEMRKHKHYFDQGVPARFGIEF